MIRSPSFAHVGSRRSSFGKEVSGAMLMISQGVMLNAWLMLGKILKESGWPFWRLAGTGCFIQLTIIVVSVIVGRADLPRGRQMKWAALRGMFGGLSGVLLVLPVQLGVPLGDVAGLTSINLVMAALFGRMLLGEKLNSLHGIAVVCSTAGAIMISQPEFLFGASQAAGLLGYSAALGSGVLQACIFVCSRKAGEVSSYVMTGFTQVFNTIILWIMPYTGLIDDGSLAKIVASPIEAVGWILASLVLGTLAQLTLSSACKLCPAAISATFDTASRMVSGYILQAAIFGTSPQLLSLAGATLMIVSVAFMFLAAHFASGRRSHDWPASAPVQPVSVPAISSRSASVSEMYDSFNDIGHVSPISPTGVAFNFNSCPVSPSSSEAQTRKHTEADDFDSPIPPLSPPAASNANGVAVNEIDDETESLVSFIASEFLMAPTSTQASVRRRAAVQIAWGPRPLVIGA